uniref:BTB domain-containing protein n=1 Tax=Acrobeloides nanus TaxID=290746 RepID=A0A914BYT9_9BILA
MSRNPLVVNPLPKQANEPPGMDCFADDRDALNDFAKYFNNTHLSDVSLVIGEEVFPAHRLILCRSSEVFDRMLSQKWNGDKRVCIEYAMNYILPELSLKELFHIWFSYATKAYHQVLIQNCIQILAKDFTEIISSEDWEKDWMAIDRDQLVEILKSNELVVPNEFVLWEAVQKWLMAPSHPERRGNTSSPLMVQILPLIRFPFMTADELSQVENSVFAQSHPKIFIPHTHLAFKFMSMPLSSRAGNKDFTGTQFLLRNYTDVRWDKRLMVTNEQLYQRNVDHTFTITTRSSTFPLQAWNWSLKFSVQTFTNASDELRIVLSTEDIDQARSIEYLLNITDDKKVIRCLSGKKNFTKTRYSAELELEKKLDVTELFAENSPLLHHGNLNLQLLLRPIV